MNSTEMPFEDAKALAFIPGATGAGTVTIEYEADGSWYFSGPVAYEVIDDDGACLIFEANKTNTERIVDTLFADWFWRGEAEDYVHQSRSSDKADAAEYSREI